MTSTTLSVAFANAAFSLRKKNTNKHYFLYNYPFFSAVYTFTSE